MKKTRLLSLLCALALCAGLFSVGAAGVSAEGYTLPKETTVYADAAILVSLAGRPEDDVVLFQKNADTVHAPGSMMRYMVLAYALHRIQEDNKDIDKTTAAYTEDMFNHYVAGTGVPTVNMNFGETWTLRHLLTVSFMQSASDAVTTLAYAIDGGVAPFIDGMNSLAAKIGCTYTHFGNLTGVDSLSQYTTARDMYRIVRYAQSFSLFEELASPYQVKVKPVSGGKERTIVSGNKMLQPSSPHRYTPLVYSRTGLSEHEGRTCTSVARDSGYEYLVVVMGCPEKDREGNGGVIYQDTKTLMRWAFKQFSYTTVLTKSEILASLPVELSWETDHVNLIPQKEVATIVESKLAVDQIIRKVTLYEKRLHAPVEKGTVLGKVELFVNVDQKIGETPLVAYESVNRSWPLYVWSQVSGFFTSPWFFVGLGLVVVLLIAYGILNVIHNRRLRRDRLQRVKSTR